MDLKKLPPNNVETVRIDREITGQTRESILPTVTVDTFKTSITPIVKLVSNLRLIYCNNSIAITVTNFTGGAEGQSIALRGDGNTTIQNNANIVTNTGADKLLTVDKIYRFTLVQGKWLEDE